MNIRESNVKKITNWFRRILRAEFALPNGHFGRPNDWSYSLEKVYHDSEELIIKLDTDKTFVFDGDATVDEHEKNLELYGFKKLTFTWEDSSPGVYHVEEFYEGKVIFIPDPYAKMRSSWK